MQESRKFPKKSENTSRACLYEFGPFCVNPQKRIVLRDGEPLPLTPKCFDLLLFLVQHPAEVLVKEELMETVWQDTVVEEGNLNRNISTLRKALGELPNEHRYIVTVPGRGYRFVADVRELFDEQPTVIRREALTADESGEFQLESHIRRNSVQPMSVHAPVIVRPPMQAAGRTKFKRYIWVTAAVAAGVVVMTLIYVFAFRPKPAALTANDLILIADFSNSTGDTVFDDTLKQGLSVDLSQSPYLSILSDAKVHATLKLMTKPADTRLTAEVVREVCQRAGAKAYITGSIARLDSEYVLGLNAFDCETGDSLAGQQVKAASKDGVLKALDEASAKIRNRLGESLNTVAKYDIPLEQATTASLEALKAFTQGNLVRDKEGDAATIAFFKHAIELDPQFALAYDALATSYSNLDEPGLASANLTRAYELRDRTTELEKLHIAANYSQIVTGELSKANQISELWAQTYPFDPYPHNLLGVNFEFLGQYDQAVREIGQALRLYPDGVLLHSDLMEDYIALNLLDRAKATYELALGRNLDHAFLHADRYAVAFLEGDRKEMDQQVAWSVGKPGAEDLLLSLESDTCAFQGNLKKARQYSRRAAESASRADQKETAALWRMNGALREAEFGNFARAVEETDAVIFKTSSRDVQILAALTLARAGGTAEAQKIEKELAGAFPSNTVINGYWLPSIRAAIELSRDNPSASLEILSDAVAYEFGYPNPQVQVGRYLYPVYLRGLAYLRLRRGREAAAEFEKFLSHPSLVVNCPLGALARLGLARSYTLMGDTQKARTAYQQLFDLWRDADREIPVLKQATAEYATL